MHLHNSQQGSGENLVLLHGWGMNSAAWRGMLPHLQENYCVQCIDLPGHGRSDVLLNVADVELLDAWLDALQAVLPERFYLCGWSLGGMLALALQQRWPERVQGVVVLAASPRFVQAASWPGQPLEDLLSFAQSLDVDVQATLRQFVGLQFLNAKNSRAAVRTVLQDLQQQGEVSQQGMQQGLHLLQHMDLRPGFASQACAVLLGEQDRLVPAALGAAMQALNAQCQLELWADSGHAPHLTQPARVAEFIHTYINKSLKS